MAAGLSNRFRHKSVSVWPASWVTALSTVNSCLTLVCPNRYLGSQGTGDPTCPLAQLLTSGCEVQMFLHLEKIPKLFQFCPESIIVFGIAQFFYKKGKE